MKNNKSMPAIIGLIILVIILAGVCVFLLTKKEKEVTEYDGKGREVLNIQESTKKIPNFSVNVLGDYTGIINDEFIIEDGIKMYDFEAAVDTGWHIVKEQYTGVRLRDLIKYYQLENFVSVDFTSLDKITIQYLNSEITDNCFLVFYKDGKLITNTGRPMLLAVDYDIRFSLKDVIDMNFVVGESDRVDTDSKKE